MPCAFHSSASHREIRRSGLQRVGGRSGPLGGIGTRSAAEPAPIGDKAQKIQGFHINQNQKHRTRSQAQWFQPAYTLEIPRTQFAGFLVSSGGTGGKKRSPVGIRCFNPANSPRNLTKSRFGPPVDRSCHPPFRERQKGVECRRCSICDQI